MTTIFSGSIAVPADFTGVHAIGAYETFASGIYDGGVNEPANYAIGSYRLYGSWHGAYYYVNDTTFDWTELDAMATKYRSATSAARQKWIYTNFNIPDAWQSIPFGGGEWAMCLPLASKKIYWENFILALMARYPEIGIWEVANEAMGGTAGQGYNGAGYFWRGSDADLRTLSTWCLDLRAAIDALPERSGRPPIEIHAPSIPGFTNNEDGVSAVFGSYARRNEFDSWGIHLYYSDYTNMFDSNGFGNCYPQMRAILDGWGLNAKPINDNEHGFGSSLGSYADGGVNTQFDAILYNTIVRGAVGGLRHLTLFNSGLIDVNTDAYIGRPSLSANARAAIEAASAAVDGKTVTLVTWDDNPTHRFVVTATPTGGGGGSGTPLFEENEGQDAMIIPQSTSRVITFKMVDTSGNAKTGLVDGSFTKRISKNATAFGAMTVTITELETGLYTMTLSASHTDTIGPLRITLAAAASKTTILFFQVEADAMFAPTRTRFSNLDTSVGAVQTTANTINTNVGTANTNITTTLNNTTTIISNLATTNGTVNTINSNVVTLGTNLTTVNNNVLAVPNSLLDQTNGVETGLTVRQALRALGSFSIGKVSGARSPTEVFRAAVADHKTRLTYTVDGNGNRLLVATDLT